MIKRQFKPTLVPSLVVILLFPILVRLGFWQLDRAEEKRLIQTEFELRTSLPVADLRRDFETVEEMKYRRVKAVGQFDPNHHILLDNKVHERVAGYHVLTPLKIEGLELVILVNRGWIPRGLDRQVIPQFDTPLGRVEVNGVISIPNSKVFTLSDYNREGDKWPAIYQWIDFADIEKQTDTDLVNAIILQDPEDKAGFVRHWSKVNLQPEKNISYAIQWFALSLALLVIYVVVNLKKVEVTVNE